MYGDWGRKWTSEGMEDDERNNIHKTRGCYTSNNQEGEKSM